MLMDADFDNTKEGYIKNETTMSNGASNGHHVHYLESMTLFNNILQVLVDLDIVARQK
jgi:hypothetical protein